MPLRSKLTLRAEEREWLSEKRRHCAVDAVTGPDPGVAVLVCETAETAKRANELDARSIVTSTVRTAEVAYPTGQVIGNKAKWPANGVAERLFFDVHDGFPEGMFVEELDGRLHAWVLLSSKDGHTKAIDFFSGVVHKAQVDLPGSWDYTFVDENGMTHRSTEVLDFFYSEPYRHRVINDVLLDGPTVQIKNLLPCSPDEFHVLQRTKGEDGPVMWRKALLHRLPGVIDECPNGIWGSGIDTTLELADGTMLIAADSYVFRVRLSDMSPVGSAPHLRVVDAARLERALEHADPRHVSDGTLYVYQKLGID